MGTIAEQINYLAETKTAIKEAIVAKGVSVADYDTFRSYAEKIASIETGGGGSSMEYWSIPNDNDANSIIVNMLEIGLICKLAKGISIQTGQTMIASPLIIANNNYKTIAFAIDLNTNVYINEEFMTCNDLWEQVKSSVITELRITQITEEEFYS